MAYYGPGRLNILVNKAFRSRSLFYKPLQTFFRYLFHLEIPARFFYNGLYLIHPYNVIIHPDTMMGSNITVYHNVTMAVKKNGKNKGAPVVGDNVIVYPHSVILGNVTIGRNSIVGAGSVVIHDVPADCCVAGNPARPVGNVDGHVQ
jgi:serine O-acetyltransferase